MRAAVIVLLLVATVASAQWSDSLRINGDIKLRIVERDGGISGSVEHLALGALSIAGADSSGGYATVTFSCEADDSPWLAEWQWRTNYDGEWSSSTGNSVVDLELSTVATAGSTSDYADADSVWVRLRGRRPTEYGWTAWKMASVDYDRTPAAPPPEDTTGPVLAASDSSYNDVLDRAIAELTSDEPCTLTYRVRENQGEYATAVVSDTLWAFVTDADNLASDGLPIIWGGEGQDGPPDPPAGPTMTATRSGTNASVEVTGLSGTIHYQIDQAAQQTHYVSTSTTVTIPFGTQAADVTASAGADTIRSNIPE